MSEADFRVTLEGQPMDGHVVAANARSLVPLRAIVELLGADVDWVDEVKAALMPRGRRPSCSPSG